MIDRNSKAVVLTDVDSYEQDKVDKAVERHFELLGLNEKLKPATRVLIKPNLLLKRRPEEFTTTHPTLIIAIAKRLKAIGVTDITLADSPGGPYTKAALSGIYDGCGMKAACEETGIRLNLDCGSFTRKSKGGAVNEFTLITPIKNADFIIDVGKLKTHAMTNMSGAVKNLFGAVPGLMKPEMHWRFPEKPRFCEMLVDLCETVAPDVCFIDGITAMEGDGPSGGTAKQANIIISGLNPYNVDMALTRIIGTEPDKVLTVAAAVSRGLCVKSADELLLLGDRLREMKFLLPKAKGLSFYDSVPSILKKPTRLIVNKFFTPKPIIRRKSCIGCGKCAESCPAHTITVFEQKASINYDNCIKCFCCHEMCPVKAIDIKRTKILNF